jgi:UDP:flavonoid glycosyltransferase YjiC (YdhE family)
MRLLFASLASHGHIYPLLPLAFAAREAGHEVVFATGEEFLDNLRSEGLKVALAGISLGDAFNEAFDGSRHGISPEVSKQVMSKVFGDVVPRHVVHDLRPVFDEFKPDLVIHEVANAGAGMAAALAGVPGLAHSVSRGMEAESGAAVAEAMRPLAAELGLPEPGEHALTLGNRYLDIWPSSLQAAAYVADADRIPLRPVAWSPRGELPEGIRDKTRPLVYLTLGTAFGHAGVLRAAIDGLSRLPVDVLLAAGPTVGVDDLGTAPDNVRILGWVPQAELLPHVDVVVHHGGSGTTLGASAAGKPQLIMPQGADQFTNADALLAAGTGARLLPGELTADAVTDQVRRLLDSESVQAAAQRVFDEIAAMPSPDEIAARLPTLAG